MKTTVAETDRAAIKSKGREVSGSPIASDLQASISVKNILVPLDFSRASMHALDYATALAEQFKAQIHLVHVQMPDEACAMPSAGHLMRECAESVTFLHQKLAGITTERRPQFWPENCHIRNGHAYKEICDLARELNIDLIALASRGNTGLKRLVLGSTAERVVRFSACPVLVVHQRKEKVLDRSAKNFRIRKILAPVDFSQCSMAGVMYAGFMAKEFDAELRLFHLVQLPARAVIDRLSPEVVNTGRSKLPGARLEMEAFRQLDFLRGVKVDVQIQTGHSIKEIYAETKSPDVDLVVISTHGRSGFNRMLLGSVAEHVVRYAECPVLVVPSRRFTS
jgi:nucleotide-binding universal stress UspA family protein